MSANFEIGLKLKKKVVYSEVVKLINEYFHDIDIKEVHVIDNWKYENHSKLINISDKKINQLLDIGKKIIIYAKIEKNINSGLYLMQQNRQSIILLWIDTKVCEYLDSDFIDIYNEKIYKQIISCIIDINSKLDIEVCAMGAEMDFNYTGNIQACIRESENVVCWILFDDKKIIDISNYNIAKINQSVVYWKSVDINNIRK